MKLLFLFFLFMLFSSQAFSQIYFMRVTNKSDGSSQLFNIDDIKDIKFSGNISTDIKELEKLTASINELNRLKCYPNPSNSDITLEFNMPESGNFDFKVFNNIGEIVFKKLYKNQTSGEIKINWSGTDQSNNFLTPGYYICNIIFKETKLQEKLIIIK